MRSPIITTYNNHAHLISILGNIESTKAWIINNYMDIFIYNDYSWRNSYFNNSEKN